MVSQKVLIRDRRKWLKKILKVFGVLAVIGLILGVVFFSGFFIKKPGKRIVLENPLKNIVFANTNEQGEVDYNAVVEQGILEFNVDYINYLLVALGVNNLHKSLIGYGNPKVELVLDDEVWSSEVVRGGLNTKKSEIDDEDLKIVLSKKEAVEALLVNNVQEFMINSVYEGGTRIEMIAGKIELGSKGYLGMYKDLTGEEIEIEE